MLGSRYLSGDLLSACSELGLQKLILVVSNSQNAFFSALVILMGAPSGFVEPVAVRAVFCGFLLCTDWSKAGTSNGGARDVAAAVVHVASCYAVLFELLIHGMIFTTGSRGNRG